MKRTWNLLPVLGLAAILGLPGNSPAQDHPHTEGSVWEVTYVKTAPGHFEDYLRDLAAGWKRVNDAAVERGYVTSYKILAGGAADREDWDLMLLVEYPNMAALDDGMEKFDPIVTEVFGSLPKSQQANVQRSQLREILGEKLAREIILK